jgi:hypothetical protein
MNISQDKLNQHIKLYLNDIYDYSDDENHHKLVESTLTPFSKLTESGGDFSTMLKEMISKSAPEDKKIIKDFLTYIKEV